MNIAVTGSLAYDNIMDFSGKFADRIMPDKIHQISLSFLVDSLSKQFGGTAVNIAYSLKLLEENPLILAPAGNDFERYKKHLNSYKISTKYIKEFSDVPCGTYSVITDVSDNQIGAFYVGALKYAQKLSLKSITKKIDFVMLAPTGWQAMDTYVDECIELKLPFMFDPAFQIGDFPVENLRKGIDHAKILIGNDYEVALIEKKLNLTHAKLVEKVPILITTLGEKGSLIESAGKKYEIPVAKVENISDPTGAGDAYRAGFLSGYSRKFDLEVCGRMGAVAAAYTVEEYGTQTHEYNFSGFALRYMKNFKADKELFTKFIFNVK